MKCLEEQLSSSHQRYTLTVMLNGEPPQRRIKIILRELDDPKGCGTRGGMNSSGITALSFK